MEEFGIGSSIIYSIKTQAKQLRAFIKKTETSKTVEQRHTLQQKRLDVLDKIPYEWFCLKRSEYAALSDSILQKKAKKFSAKMTIIKSCQFLKAGYTKVRLAMTFVTLMCLARKILQIFSMCRSS